MSAMIKPRTGLNSLWLFNKEEDESLFPAKPNGKPYARVKVAKLEALTLVELTSFFQS